MRQVKVENLKKQEKSKWGGVRIGAGRKPKLQYEVRELFNLTVDEEWENISKVLRYYIRKGDKEIVKWIVEQRIGKAPQNLDISAKGAFLNVSEQINPIGKSIDVMEIAKKVSAELKKLKIQK
jgi:hypothetical protein